MKIKINTAPTQFTGGKTNQELQAIYRDVFRYESCEYEEEEGIPFHVICTNNSLTENGQWASRCHNFSLKGANNQEIFRIVSLTSRRDSFNSKEKLMMEFHNNVINKTIQNFPNILTICSHKQRLVNDLPYIIQHLNKGVSNAIQMQFYIRIVFDEPDVNITNIKSFWNEMVNLKINMEKIELVFVTATVSDKLRDLIFNKISKESNTNIENVYYGNDDYDKLCENYRFFESHKKIVLNNLTTNPVEYVKDVYRKKYIDETKRVIVFAPAHNTKNKHDVGSHEEMKNFFLRRKYDVLLLNGSFKGIYTCNGDTLSLQYLKDLYKLPEKCELRDILREWACKNQEKNLAIVGCTLVERGVTFNTNGFNFTHMIISSYHTNQMNRFIQICGRATGNKDFVDNIIVISPECLFESYKNYFSAYNRLKSDNPEFFVEDDFKKINGTTNKNKCVNEDFAYEIYDTMEEAVEMVKTKLGCNASLRERTIPENLTGIGGGSPTLEQVLNKKSGLSKENKYRIFPINTNQHVVYWRPSFFKK